MIKERIANIINLPHVCKLMIYDLEGFSAAFDYTTVLLERGFRIVHYTNVEAFRARYEENVKTAEERIAVVIRSDIYVPYDAQQRFRKVRLSLSAVFPKLHAETVRQYIRDIDLISFAYDSCYANSNEPAQTRNFIEKTVFGKANIKGYCQAKTEYLRSLVTNASRHSVWIELAQLKAKIHYYEVVADFRTDLSFVDEAFAGFIFEKYGNLSSELGKFAPAIITKTLAVICTNIKPKVAIIVMDGMSMFDFEVISRHFAGIDYDLGGSFALMPTTTTISRQSLLSGKFPRELERPFPLAGEEKEFIEAGMSLGYAKNQIQYLRGYFDEISPFARLVSVIINDVDDIVHGQHQERVGMFNDMNVLGKSGKLTSLIKALKNSGFEIYITADHGNTPCVGVGGFRSGVELETRSMRMAVLKDFADESGLLAEYAMEYPGYYLDKKYRYFICKSGVSFDSKGERVMTHGGMSIDEVIVPFVKIKEVQ
jgi:hypothetical protein